MSIRRVGFNPFVSTASLVQAQRRVDPVEKHIGADDPELKTEEDGLESLNSHYRAELEALEAERARKAQQVETLRSRLMMRDGYEKLPEELVDLKGGTRDELEQPEPRHANKPGVSLAQLARANVYERVSREERAAAQRAELEQAEAELRAAEHALAAQEAAAAAAAELEEGFLLDESPAEEDAADWMAEELEVLQQAEDVDDEEEVYSDPGADLFLASLDDIENLEPAEVEDPHAGAFVASLDDIENLEPAPAEALLPFEDDAEDVKA
ncbi:hypothetical protein [Melittangium boletus]|uniref:Exosome complex exonuclease 1 n=1 Tax=Melittangium boletus DSM 14713 TaxID=1294270 RepID=A0A250IEA2_9BACT|nr:hypothetical protein [Melittangium boletus]ATB30174.1 exosome complex exonuclease 1 [Melittangium boletus DSM 14713]